MLSVFSLQQSSQWDTIVRSFKEYDIYWLSGYVKAFKIHGDGEPLLFFFEGKGIRGINVVMKRDIALDRNFAGKMEPGIYFDFATPYGYGGWLIEGEGAEKLFNEYEKWCIKNNIISEFVRFHPVLKNHIAVKDGYDVVTLGEIIILDISSPETIWLNITGKNRNCIRKAQKNGIKIYNGCYPQIYEIFREIYNSTMNRDSAKEYYYFEANFYESILNDIPQNAQVFYAVLEEKIIAATIMLIANGRMNYHLSGYLKEYGSFAPSNLMLYESALWGCEKGCKTLYLGGGVGSEKDDLFKFKKAFYRGNDVNRFFIGKKIFDKERYSELMDLWGKTEETEFFPQYRG